MVTSLHNLTWDNRDQTFGLLVKAGLKPRTSGLRIPRERWPLGHPASHKLESVCHGNMKKMSA